MSTKQAIRASSLRSFGHKLCADIPNGGLRYARTGCLDFLRFDSHAPRGSPAGLEACHLSSPRLPSARRHRGIEAAARAEGALPVLGPRARLRADTARPASDGSSRRRYGLLPLAATDARARCG